MPTDETRPSRQDGRGCAPRDLHFALDANPRHPVNRRFGAYRGEFEVPDTFFEPLPEVDLAAFEGLAASP
jgi:hypothetical protein